MDLKQSCGASRNKTNNAVKHVKVKVCKTQTLKEGCQTLVHIVAPMTACSNVIHTAYNGSISKDKRGVSDFSLTQSALHTPHSRFNTPHPTPNPTLRSDNSAFYNSTFRALHPTILALILVRRSVNFSFANWSLKRHKINMAESDEHSVTTCLENGDFAPLLYRVTMDRSVFLLNDPTPQTHNPMVVSIILCQ